MLSDIQCPIVNALQEMGRLEVRVREEPLEGRLGPLDGVRPAQEGVTESVRSLWLSCKGCSGIRLGVGIQSVTVCAVWPIEIRDCL